MTTKPIPEMTDQELDELIARLLEEPAFRGMATHHLQWILRANPDFPTVARQHYAERMERLRQQDAVLAPVIAELNQNGVPATTDGFMYDIEPEPYARAIPILVKWLPLINQPMAKEWLARCLTVPLARPYVPAIIAEFRRMRDQPPSLPRWAVGNAIGFQIDAELADDALAIAADPAYGEDRSEIVRNLWRLKADPRVFPLLDELLDADDYIDLVALEALRRQADPRARPYLERYLTHPEAWVRNNAKRGIAKIDKKLAKDQGRPSPHPPTRTAATTKPGRAPRPWPSGLPHDALVTLVVNHLIELEALAGYSASALLARNGIGPKTIQRIQDELRARGLAPLTP